MSRHGKLRLAYFCCRWKAVTVSTVGTGLSTRFTDVNTSLFSWLAVPSNEWPHFLSESSLWHKKDELTQKCKFSYFNLTQPGEVLRSKKQFRSIAGNQHCSAVLKTWSRWRFVLKWKKKKHEIAPDSKCEYMIWKRRHLCILSSL